MTRHSRPPSRDALSRRGFLGAAAAALTAPAALRAGTAPAPTETRREISRHGVTFRFAAPRPVGRYVTGDWFVVGPVEIVAISPESRRTGAAEWNRWKDRDARIIHGAQLDYHLEDRTRQGLDDIVWRDSLQLGFLPELNVDPGFTGRPLAVDRPATVIKAVSLPAAEVGRHLRPCLETIVFLTVVDEAPPEGAFRPSAEPGGKRALWTAADLDPDALPSLPLPAGVNPAALDPRRRLALNERPHWNARGRYGMTRPMMARANQHRYGREHAYETGYALMALCTDRPWEEKRELCVALVQQGLDLAAMIAAGQKIKASDGNSLGRAAPLAFAAAALRGAGKRDPALTEAADAQASLATSEAGQFFAVDDSVIGRPRAVRDRPRGPYVEDMRGIPEFSGQHILYTGRLMQPERAGSHHMMSYRNIVSCAVMPGALAAQRIRGMTAAWNHPELFAYLDRWHGIERWGADDDLGRLHYGDRIGGITAACWADWRPDGEVPVHRARPAPMIAFGHDRTLDIAVTRAAPLLVPDAGGFVIHPLLNQFRDRALDDGSRHELRWSEDGESWEVMPDAGLAPRRIGGLRRETRYFVQMRQAHPEHGAGPWSFQWWWWKDGISYDGRFGAGDGRWTEVEGLGGAPAAMRWLSATHRRKAVRVQLRPRREDRKPGPWRDPFWLHPEMTWDFPADLPRSSPAIPSVTTF